VASRARFCAKLHFVAPHGNAKATIQGRARRNEWISTMPTTVKKRSVVVGGHRTSISLERAFWDALRRLAQAEGKTINQMVSDIDAARQGNLSSAIRVYVLSRASQGYLPPENNPPGILPAEEDDDS
jgi:predicted DNA-binding ribbon-helix-helix protein